ncbi:protein PLANT CADMIUM RESISTANCE 12 isoform X1 [Ricinus communis]|uniref:protein PLANT CADMIUM RESISTANCE 12 isoform X1 n=1 Tax=Ricinus communis TaxID=3988 RepID=UPI00201B1176|nr:protein PLANT CADMIUM RESISTANCE 12 isoform X1 [Ricinus communis]XP_048231411.1 protein PLANT CADMIUM RESISTANCE 12 isoform X1 [Ricinus communis]
MHPKNNEEQYSKSTAMEKWTTGLCGCFEDPWNCIKTCLCPCVTFGQNAEILDRNGTSCFCGGLLLYLLSCVGCPCIYSFSFRTKLRQQFSLPKEPCGDFLVHCCCPSCAICQEYRELKNRGINPSKGTPITNTKPVNSVVECIATTCPVIQKARSLNPNIILESINMSICLI